MVEALLEEGAMWWCRFVSKDEAERGGVLGCLLTGLLCGLLFLVGAERA